MSIAPVLKLTLIGPAAARERWLAALQEAGFLHVYAALAAKTGAIARDARAALRDLAEAPRLRAQVRDPAGFDRGAFVAEVLAAADRRAELHDRRDALAKRIEALRPWGELAEIEALHRETGLEVWLAAIPRRMLARLEQSRAPWALAGLSNTEAFVVLFSRERPDLGDLRGRFGPKEDQPLSALRHELAGLDLAIDEAEAEREALTRRYDLLAASIRAAEDAAAFAAVLAALRDEERLCAVQGWAAAERRAEIEAFAAAEGLAAVFEPPGPQDDPPVLLQPAAGVAAGRDLAAFYQLPSARDWDPSGALFVSFSAFFGIIVSDAGYALLLLAIWLVWRPKSAAASVSRRIRALWAACALAALLSGALTGSYFGWTPAPDTLLGRLRVIDLSRHQEMLALCALVGGLHVAYANLMAAWAARGRLESVSRLGWLLVLAGAGVLALRWGEDLGPGLGILGGGLALVAVGAGGVLPALGALANLTKLLSDVLSYLRLFALALAGAALAAAFNDLAMQARAAVPGLGLLLAGLILLFGHGLNFILVVAGGVVHGLRLNFIEFYNWSLTGEGRPFSAFAKRG